MKNPGSGQDGPVGSFLFELDEFLPYRLSLLTNTVSAGIARSYRDQHQISVIEWRIMAVLGRYPGLTAKEIGERTAMDKVAISRAVKSLVERRLLERVTDPEDRRRMHLLGGPVAEGHAKRVEEGEAVTPPAFGEALRKALVNLLRGGIDIFRGSE